MSAESECGIFSALKQIGMANVFNNVTIAYNVRQKSYFSYVDCLTEI